MSNFLKLLSVLFLLHISLAAQDYQFSSFTCQALATQVIKVDYCEWEDSQLWFKINVSEPVRKVMVRFCRIEFLKISLNNFFINHYNTGINYKG